MVRHLGFDIGFARLGWAVIERDGQPVDLAAGVYSGLKLINYDVIETDKREMHEVRLKALHDQTAQLIKAVDPDFCILEKPMLIGARCAAEVFEALGVIRLALWQSGYTCIEISPSSVKKIITGKGNAKKPVVRDAVKAIYSLKVMHKLDDAWDALAIATCLGEIATVRPAATQLTLVA